MKKMKKILAVILSLAMVLGMSITAFAATNKTSIVVNKLDKNATVKYVQIIRPNLEQPTGWEFVDAAYANAFKGVNSAYADLSDQDIIWKLIKMKNDSATNMPDGTVKMETSEFQKALISINATETANVDYTQIANGTVTIKEIASAGIYVVKADSTGNYTYSPMAAYVSFDNYDKATGIPSDLKVEPITAKSTTVDITKENNEEDKVVAVGKQVEYTVTTQIPYVSDNNPINKYEIVDTINGANYVTNTEGKVAVKVKVGDLPEETVSVDVVNSSITIPLTKYLGLKSANLNKYANAPVVIKYDAVVTDLTVKNTVKPGDGKHNFTPVTDTLYTGTVTLTKTGGADKSALLKDAKFVLVKPETDSEGAKYAIVEKKDGYYQVVNWTDNLETAKAESNLIVTDENGKAVVKGLDDSVEYEFQEIVAPEGYSINKDNAVTKWDTTKPASDRQGAATMNDTTLSELPSTGGMGTTLFTIAGCAIMVAAAFFFFTSRKKANK